MNESRTVHLHGEVVRYVQVVGDVAQEPDYDAVIRAVRELL